MLLCISQEKKTISFIKDDFEEEDQKVDLGKFYGIVFLVILFAFFISKKIFGIKREINPNNKNTNTKEKQIKKEISHCQLDVKQKETPILQENKLNYEKIPDCISSFKNEKFKNFFNNLKGKIKENTVNEKTLYCLENTENLCWFISLIYLLAYEDNFVKEFLKKIEEKNIVTNKDLIKNSINYLKNNEKFFHINDYKSRYNSVNDAERMEDYNIFTKDEFLMKVLLYGISFASQEIIQKAPNILQKEYEEMITKYEEDFIALIWSVLVIELKQNKLGDTSYAQDIFSYICGFMVNGSLNYQNDSIIMKIENGQEYFDLQKKEITKIIVNENNSHYYIYLKIDDQFYTINTLFQHGITNVTNDKEFQKLQDKFNIKFKVEQLYKDCNYIINSKYLSQKDSNKEIPNCMVFLGVLVKFFEENNGLGNKYILECLRKTFLSNIDSYYTSLIVKSFKEKKSKEEFLKEILNNTKIYVSEKQQNIEDFGNIPFVYFQEKGILKLLKQIKEDEKKTEKKVEEYENNITQLEEQLTELSKEEEKLKTNNVLSCMLEENDEIRQAISKIIIEGTDQDDIFKDNYIKNFIKITVNGQEKYVYLIYNPSLQIEYNNDTQHTIIYNPKENKIIKKIKEKEKEHGCNIF